jgi:diguanylate cyclase (GGDEF)-like protein
MVSLTADPEHFTQLGRQVHYSGEGSNEIVELIDGRILEVQTNPQLLHGAVVGQVWSFRDVTERERMQSNLTQLASLDSLTGLQSRRRFQDEVNATIARGEQGAILFMDVDDFKAINDSFGHSAGDDLLRSLALCLTAGLREQDLLARLGGDEFAVLLRGVTRGQAARIAQRMLKAVREMRVLSADHPVSSTISIGGALFPAHGTSVDEVLGHADLAMYRAKDSGRNKYQLYRAREATRSSSVTRVRWKQRIIEALEKDRFTLYAQPIFELSSGRLGCYELLLRMRDGAGRLIPPTKFLYAAERSGLMHEIDAWVVRHSFVVAKLLAAAPEPVKVSFNLSATAVGNGALLDLIRREAAQARLEPGFITIEVTETALIGDIQKARAFFKSLKNLGFRISLDDFGAGFSSFTRLKQVPADYLKIDGSFIQNIARSEQDRHFVKAIADLASGLGIGAVAEWVQDEESVGILIGLGVLNGQGFYLGAPQPIARILDAHLLAAKAA